MPDPKLTVKISGDGKELEVALIKGKKEIADFAQDAEAAGKRSAAAMDKAAKTAAQMALAVGSAMAAATAAMVRQAAEVEANLRNVNTMAKLSETGFKNLTTQVLELSSSMQGTKGPKELSSALYEIYSAGLEGEKAMAVLENAAKAADAGLTDTKTAVNVLTTAMLAFRAPAEDAARFSDILFKTVERGKIDFEQLASSIGPALTKASAFGVKIEEVGAAMAQLSQVMPAAEASTAIERLMTQLAAPTEESAKKMAELGVEFGRGAIEAKGFMAVLQDVIRAADGNDLVLRKMLSSSEALQAALALTSDQGAGYVESLRAMESATGAMDAALKEQAKSAKFAWAEMQKEAEITAVRIGNELLPKITKAMKDGTQAMRDARQAWDTNWMGIRTAVYDAANLIETQINRIGIALTAMTRAGLQAREFLADWGIGSPTRDPRSLGMSTAPEGPTEIHGLRQVSNESLDREAAEKAARAAANAAQTQKMRESALAYGRGKGHTPTAEETARARLVAAALGIVGTNLTKIPDAAGNLGTAANKCADTVRAIGQSAGVKFGVADVRNAVDGPAVRAIGQGVGPDHADSIPGKLIPASQVKAGDMALFKNTDPRYPSNVVTHIGVIIDPVKGLMVDARTSAGEVVKRRVDSFRSDQLFGFLRPEALEGLGKDKTGGSGIESFEDQAKAPGIGADRAGAEIFGRVRQAEEARIAAKQAYFDHLRAMGQASNDQELAWIQSTLDATIASESTKFRLQEQAHAIEQARKETATQAAAFWEGAQTRIQAALEVQSLATQQHLADMEFQRQMGWISTEEYLQRLQLELEAFVGTEEQKRALMLEIHELKKSLDAEQMESANNIVGSFESSLQQFMVQTLSGQQNFAQTFQNIWKSIMSAIIAEIVKAIVKALALRTILGGLFGGFGFFGGGVASFGANAFSSAFTGHDGGKVGLDGIQSFHTGGFVGGPNPMLAHDEVLAKLQTGEVVLSRQQVAALQAAPTSNQTNMTNTIYAQTTADPHELAREIGRDITWKLQGVQ